MIKTVKNSQRFGAGLLLPLAIAPADPFDVLNEWIWPIFAAVNLLNLVYVQWKLAAIVRNHPELRRESQVLLKWLFIFAVLPFLLLATLQRLGGFDHAFYVFSNNYHNPYVVLGWSVFILLNLTLLYAVLWGGAVRTLVKFREAFPRMSGNETQIKIMFVLSLLSGSFSLFMLISANTFAKLHG